ncbi:hypothetical protein CLV92_105267 [Kineococcus xinjiangensis]|uniref:Streptomycin adenylyltransferase n=1 Tax=Kineococcus xinjiangensis TaxID=512762 RepID=A0A2S6IPR6_9ACTN|nr:hypothetical protein [Kineococcus xinjiangensis]PPK96165.1 hypothetical protein CLV92_105267 [Kineococcus xinjiangensis]
MTTAQQPGLRRLDELAGHLATRGEVVAVLGLGSAGRELERFDEHSDLDVFVVVEDGAAKQRYLGDGSWLAAPCAVVFSFANTADGRKALYADGLFVEYAVFTADELASIPYTGARAVWARADAPRDLTRGRAPGPRGDDTVEFHLNEALTNLLVGMHRELRGERLAACRFIQSFAVDRILDLLRLSRPAPSGTATPGADPFEPSRRVELAHPADELPLARLVPGYDANPAAARAALEWLRARFDVDAALAAAVEELLQRAAARPSASAAG